MNKTFIVFMIFGLLAVATFAHKPHHHHDRNEDLHGIFQSLKDKEKDGHYPFKFSVKPGVTFVENVSVVPKVFEVSVSEGDALAVQIEHVSDLSFCSKCGPSVISLTRMSSDRSSYRTNDRNGKSLSFEVSADELSRFAKGSSDALTYSFSLDTLQTPRYGGARVGLLVCVGPEASLATCVSPCTLQCTRGASTPSKVMDVCVCYYGYVNDTCNVYNQNYTSYIDYDGDTDDSVKAFLMIFFFTLCGIVSCIACSCCCLVVCACFARRSSTKKGRVVSASQPPSGMTNPYAYHPLGVSGVPPPPPPPTSSQPSQPTQPVGQAIEMTTLPASSSVNPVFVMPPLAPVRQVPVFVKPSNKN